MRARSTASAASSSTREWNTIRIEYDATRLNKQIVYELLRRAGIDLVEELSLIPPQPPAEAAPAQAK